jgi:hypothetical protein
MEKLMKEWAMRYLERGWSVIPIKERSKSPLVDWKEYQTRKPTAEEVSKWFQNDKLNLGIVTGKVSGLAVIDLDGQDGLDVGLSHSLASSVIAQTGRGNGRHLFYRDSGVKNAVKLMPGLDLRGEGGYVLAFPSIHPDTGRRYQWLTDFRLSLPEFPKGIGIGADIKVSDGRESKPSGWIGEALSLMQHGNIDDTLFKVLSRMRNDGWTEQDAFVCLQPLALAKGAEDGHVKDKIRNIWGRYIPKATVIVDNEEAESVEDFLKSDEKVTWIVPNLLAKNSIAFVAGLPESGKTWLMQDLAIEAALGGNWLGLFPVAPTKTLFIDQERFSGETRRRIRALITAKGIKPPSKDTLFIKCGSSIKLDLEHSFSAFVRLLEKIKPELVIIDSLATIHTKEENSRSEIQSVIEKVKPLRQQFGCTFLFICHSNKFAFQAAKDGQEPGMAEMAGSIALPAAAETVLTVQRAKGGGSTVYHTKSTLAQKLGPFGAIVEDVPNGIRVRGVK